MTPIPLFAATWFVGCSEKVDGSTDPEAPDCTDFQSETISAEQIAATPRWNELAEGLALCMSGGAVVTDEALYERINADFSVIEDTIEEYEREGFWDLPSFSWRGTFPQKMTLAVDSDAEARIQEGTYDDWDCLNAWYEVDTVYADRGSWVDISFDGFYDLRYLFDEYSALPGFSSAHIEDDQDDGDSGTRMRALVDGETIYYGYFAWGGDCPEGCTEHLGLYFISSAAGVVELTGSIVDNDDEESNSAPDWASTLPECVY